MIHNPTARFYIGLVYHLMAVAALLDFGVRTGQPAAVGAAGLLLVVAAVTAYVLRRDGRSGQVRRVDR